MVYESTSSTRPRISSLSQQRKSSELSTPLKRKSTVTTRRSMSQQRQRRPTQFPTEVKRKSVAKTGKQESKRKGNERKKTLVENAEMLEIINEPGAPDEPWADSRFSELRKSSQVPPFIEEDEFKFTQETQPKQSTKYIYQHDPRKSERKFQIMDDQEKQSSIEPDEDRGAYEKLVQDRRSYERSDQDRSYERPNLDKKSYESPDKDRSSYENQEKVRNSYEKQDQDRKLNESLDLDRESTERPDQVRRSYKRSDQDRIYYERPDQDRSYVYESPVKLRDSQRREIPQRTKISFKDPVTKMETVVIIGDDVEGPSTVKVADENITLSNKCKCSNGELTKEELILRLRKKDITANNQKSKREGDNECAIGSYIVNIDKSDLNKDEQRNIRSTTHDIYALQLANNNTHYYSSKLPYDYLNHSSKHNGNILNSTMITSKKFAETKGNNYGVCKVLNNQINTHRFQPTYHKRKINENKSKISSTDSKYSLKKSTGIIWRKTANKVNKRIQTQGYSSKGFFIEKALHPVLSMKDTLNKVKEKYNKRKGNERRDKILSTKERPTEQKEFKNKNNSDYRNISESSIRKLYSKFKTNQSSREKPKLIRQSSNNPHLYTNNKCIDKEHKSSNDTVTFKNSNWAKVKKNQQNNITNVNKKFSGISGTADRRTVANKGASLRTEMVDYNSCESFPSHLPSHYYKSIKSTSLCKKTSTIFKKV